MSLFTVFCIGIVGHFVELELYSSQQKHFDIVFMNVFSTKINYEYKFIKDEGIDPLCQNIAKISVFSLY